MKCVILLLVGVTCVTCMPIQVSESEIAASLHTEEQSVHLRERRSYSFLHNYPSIVLDMLQDEYGNPGPWALTNCDDPFNCGGVSSHYCNYQTDPAFYCSDNTGECNVRKHCSIKFYVHCILFIFHSYRRL